MPVMPDTRIPLSGMTESSQSSSPFQTLGSLMKIKEEQLIYQQRQREAEMQRREMEDDDAMRGALSKYERPEEAIDELWKSGRSTAATKLSKNVYDARTAKLTEYNEKLKSQGSRLEMAAQMLGGVNDDRSYQTARKAVLELVQPIYGDAINDYLPTSYGDGSEIKKLVAAGTSRAQQIQISQNQIANLQRGYDVGLNSAADVERGDPTGTYKAGSNVSQWSPNGLQAQDIHQENLARTLVNAQTKEQWDQGLMLAHEFGVPQSVIDKFGPWGPQATERARNLGFSLKERASAEASARQADVARDRAETADEREARLARQADRSGGGRGLSEGQRYNEQDSLEKEHADTEKWVHEWWDNESRRNIPAEERAKTKGAFNYEVLPAGIKKQYVDRRVATENKNRQRLQGLPPIDVAAKRAVAQGDVAGYEKLRKVYEGITNGLGKLEDVVKPPKGAPGSITPEARKELATVLEQLKDRTLSPAKRQELERRRDQLAPR